MHISNILRSTFAFMAMATLFSAPFSTSVSAEPLAANTDVKVDVKEVEVGTGETAVINAKVLVHYTGWLMDGTKFDSSVDRGEPIAFTLGAGQVIPGWEMGLQGMKVGGKRELVIPPELAYGAQGAPGAIPPNATLKFAVELMGVTLPNYTNIDNEELKALLARGVPLVDVRRKEEWDQTGVIKGSHLITAFNERGTLDKPFVPGFKAVAGMEDEVILICRTGSRSSVLSQALADQVGYKKIYNVSSGITKWIKDGNAVEKP
ncbi:FKBP-type peptidyl-prolyl cis-trans isomerase [Magnetovibrio blakemorei]|nr:FKBP-type peptidyl-prolyl cis-trans isomerase [Magnetovibrio blakemorei]